MSFFPSRFIAVGLVVLGAAVAVGGCCGSGPSHKCDFTPPTLPVDGGDPDVPLPCGTDVCSASQVCCLKKSPLLALCIDPGAFVTDGCETMDLQCSVPADCPRGLICCAKLAGMATVTCRPSGACVPNGSDTFIICAGDADCPNQTPSSCQGTDGSLATCAL